MQPTPGLEEIIQHRALEESHRYYGDGPTPAKNPLELLIERELDDERERNAAACEIFNRLLVRITRDPQPGRRLEWVRVKARILPGHYTRYIPANFEAGEAPRVQMIGSGGEVVQEWLPAMRKSINKPNIKSGHKNPSVSMKVLKWVSVSFADQMVKRVLSLAYLAGVDALRDKTGVGLARALLETRQAQSLRNIEEDAITTRDVGGKSGSRPLRHKANPNKGKTKEQIQIQTNPKP